MANDNICENCGASQPSGATACDFCLSALTPPQPPPQRESAQAGADPKRRPVAESSLPGLMKLYGEGRVQEVQALLTALYKQRPEAEQDVDILMLNVKVLLETDGTIGQTKQAMHKAYVLAASRADVQEYFQLVGAKEKIESSRKEKGESELKALLKRSPNNAHAMLLLGTHCFWALNDVAGAIRYLENCLRVRPVMLRAWACLGAIHTSEGRYAQAERAFLKCLEYETTPAMISYFKSMLSKRA